MQWIKASERLPEDTSGSFFIRWKHSTTENGKWETLCGSYNVLSAHVDLFKTEWLDESPESLLHVPAEVEKAAIQHADNVVPNADKNDAPYFTSSDRWQDNHDSFLAGASYTSGRMKDLEEENERLKKYIVEFTKYYLTH